MTTSSPMSFRPCRRVPRSRSRAVLCALGLGLAVAGAETSSGQESWNPFNELTQPGAGTRRSQKAPEGRPPAADPRGSGFGADGVAIPQGGPVGRPGGVSRRDAVEQTDLAPLPPPPDVVPVGGNTTSGQIGAGPPATSASVDPLQSGRSSGTRASVQVGASPAERAVAAGPDTPAEATRIAALTKLSSDVDMPTRSPAMAGLLVRVVGPRGIAGPESIEALGQRSTLLYRAGLVQSADGVAATAGDSGGRPGTPAATAFMALRTRLAFAVGDRERVCAGAASLMQAGPDLPASIRSEGITAQGYCGAASGNPAAAGLAASLGRELGGVSAGTLAALEAVAAGDMPTPVSSQRFGVIDWRLAEVGGKFEGSAWPIERFEPAALFGAGQSSVAPPRLRVGAAEAAARISAFDATALADAYRQTSFPANDLAQAQTAKVDAWARRALLFKAAEAERTPSKRTRLVRAALDDARRVGLFVPVAAAFSRIVEEIRPVPEVGWFAETAVEVLFASSKYDEARRWAQFGMQPGVTGDRPVMSLGHWMALIDIADSAQIGRRSQNLGFVEEVALRGRFSSEALHRLATVLDALDYDVPVRLWEAASRAPQPATGHLPATGILSDLQDAAKRKEHIRLVGLVFRAVGTAGPEGAHMIALGDTIRALKRAGLEAEARQIAAEALFVLWPRASSN